MSLYRCMHVIPISEFAVSPTVFPWNCTALTSCKKFFAFRDYSVWVTRRKARRERRTDANETAATTGEFHRNIRDHLRYFQRTGSCPASQREKGRGKIVKTSRPDLHSEKGLSPRDRSTWFLPRVYVSHLRHEYRMLVGLQIDTELRSQNIRWVFSTQQYHYRSVQ